MQKFKNPELTIEVCAFQNVVSAIGRITDAEHVTSWREMRRRSEVAAEELLVQLEAYLATLALNLQQLFTQPFDAVHHNFGESAHLL